MEERGHPLVALEWCLHVAEAVGEWGGGSVLVEMKAQTRRSEWHTLVTF